MAPRRQVHRRQEALEDEENLEELRAEVARMRKELDRLQDSPFTVKRKWLDHGIQ